MHSLKNTAIAVILLGLSFGLYQISLTPAPEIDPSQIPDINISEGLSQLSVPPLGELPSKLDVPLLSGTSPGSVPAANPKLPGAGSLDIASHFPTAPSAPAIQPPKFPSTPSTAPPGTPNNDRLPVVATTQNNIQSIQYPSNQTAGNEFAGGTNPPVQPLVNSPLNGGPASSGSGSQIAQRELVNPSRDQGLINALQTQPQAPDNSFVAGGNSFVANPSTLRPDTNVPVSTTLPPSAPAKAAPIGTSTSDFGPSVNKLAGADTPDQKKTMDGGKGFDAQFDSSVRTASPQPNFDQLTIKTVWPKADQLIEAEEFRTALQLLTRFYRDETLTGPQRQRLIGYLDALAGKVIFSEEDQLVSQPYTLNANESLTDVAAKWNVPAQLIFNVNQSRLPNPIQVPPGTTLKQINGPFQAEIKLSSRVLTLFLDDMYAGRFSIRVGISGEPKPGTFEVLLKSETGHAWRDSNGVDYPPGTKENGYGPHWIGLSGSLCIHAVTDETVDGHAGCIGLSATDAVDLFAILSEGSQLKIFP